MKYTFVCPACKGEKTIECAMSELKGKVVLDTRHICFLDGVYRL